MFNYLIFKQGLLNLLSFFNILFLVLCKLVFYMIQVLSTENA